MRPNFYFRYSRFEADDDGDILDWEIYTTTDQLTLMAKVVLAYQHRDTEPSFTVIIKNNHLISCACRKIPAPPVIDITAAAPLPSPQRYCFSMTLNVLTSYMHSQNRTPHGIDFVLSQGTQNPFPNCEFAWVPPDAALP